jgi:hypothetical protein
MSTMSEANPKSVLREARQLVKAHDYATALEKYIWFHDHALSADPSFAGVRLSYAITEWVELGEHYPPARKALEKMRDAKTEALVQGTGDAHLFHDVAAINRELGQSKRTSDLFKIVAATDRNHIGEKCFRIALEALVDAKEFDLARSFLTDPRKEIDQFSIPLKTATPSDIREPEIFQDAMVRIYVKRLSLILQVFVGVGDEREVNDLRVYALDCIPNTELRERARDRIFLVSSPGRIQ